MELKLREMEESKRVYIQREETSENGIQNQ